MRSDYERFRLDPQARCFLELLGQLPRVPYCDITPAMARLQYAELCRRTRSKRAFDVDADDVTIPGPVGSIPARLFRPCEAHTGALPVLVYFHGGGFCMGDLDTHDPVCRQLAHAAGCAVLSIDYRLAPEHPFPAAVEDAYAAVCFVAKSGHELGLDASRIAIGGDSSGGNLAAVCALMARDEGVNLKGKLLMYPATDRTSQRPSHKELGEGFLLTREAMDWFDAHYSGDRTDWRSSPLLAPDHSRLPPTLIIVGECDPLRDDCRAYAECLAAAGSPAEFKLFPGMIHGFITKGGIIDATEQAFEHSAQFLKSVFKPEDSSMVSDAGSLRKYASGR